LNKEYNIALLEKPLDEGLSKSEVMNLFDMLSGVNAIPIEIQGEHSTAMGFINLTDAEFMNYDYTKLEDFVKSVLNDMNNENDNCEYEVENNCGYSTLYLSRFNLGEDDNTEEFCDEINELPPVTPQKEKCKKPYRDCISRQSLLDKLDPLYKKKIKIAPDNMAEGFLQVSSLIRREPPVTPIPIPDGATNGDVFLKIHPEVVATIIKKKGHLFNCIQLRNKGETIPFAEVYIDWWDAPYQQTKDEK
jgi:hypothetical protein